MRIRRLVSLAFMMLLPSYGFAQGLENQLQSVRILYEEGRLIELGATSYNATLKGTEDGIPTGDVSGGQGVIQLSYKQDLTDRLAFAIIADAIENGDIRYPGGTGVTLAGTHARVTSAGVSALLRYRFDNNFSIFGGIRADRFKFDVSSPVAGYALNADASAGIGYVIGAAYEIPEYHARFTLTYNSKIKQDFSGTEAVGGGPDESSSFSSDLPEALKFEFQFGVSENMLLFGSAAWRNWKEFRVAPPGFEASFDEALIEASENTISYELGITRLINENWALSAIYYHTPDESGPLDDLEPASGEDGLALAVTYTKGPMTIEGGIAYYKLGGGTTELIGTEFRDNKAIEFGLGVSYSF